MERPVDWWYCLRHMRVEEGPGCPHSERMGPYATQDEAAHAMDLAKKRNEEWDSADRGD